MVKRLALFVTLALLAPAARAGAQTYFQQDCSTSNCGMSSYYGGYEGVRHDTTITSGCPIGGNRIVTTFRTGVSTTGSGQWNIGLGRTGIGTTPVQGNTYFVAGWTLVANRNNGSGGTGYEAKYAMMGDEVGGAGVTRIIWGISDNGSNPNTVSFQLNRNIDGNSPKATGEFTQGVFLPWQFRVVTSSKVAQVSSLTRSGTTVTVTTTSPHTFSVSDAIEIRAETTPDNWDQTATVTSVADSTHLTYTTGHTNTSPATISGTAWVLTSDARLSYWLGSANASISTPTWDSGTGSFGISVHGWAGGTFRSAGGYAQDSDPTHSPALVVSECGLGIFGSFQTNWHLVGGGGSPTATFPRGKRIRE